LSEPPVEPLPTTMGNGFVERLERLKS